ncbi:MAG: MBL fold metallo-hydrolase [Clostridia bacterium]|nr:MBL fold metallo-hydrolase [Clostridia bacterium]
MKITWLGQAGLLFKTSSCTVMIDPYLSNSVVKINPRNYRRVPVEERFFSIKPDILIFTHDHLDHYDPETVTHFLTAETSLTVLAPDSVWQKVRQIGGANNYVSFNRHTEWTQDGLRFTSVRAEHSDPYAIGVVITELSSDKNYYITGDTLYNTAIFADLPEKIHAVFLPVNGVGNNMNMTDAARFADKIGAEIVVPLHIGLFDTLSAEDFSCIRKIVPTFYKEIPLGE